MPRNRPLWTLHPDTLDERIARSTGAALDALLAERETRIEIARERNAAIDRLWTDYALDLDDLTDRLDARISYWDESGRRIRTEQVFGGRITYAVFRTKNGYRHRRYLGGSSARAVTARSPEAAILAALDAGFALRPR